MDKTTEAKNKNKNKNNGLLQHILWAALLSGILCLAADIAAALNDRAIALPLALALFAGTGLLLFLLQRRIGKGLGRLFLTVAGLILFFALATGAVWYTFCRNAEYIEADPENAASSGSFFKEKNVMLIVPHQDDDLNLLGGVFEEYVAGGSTVRVVFTTNGDYRNLGALRINEALNVLTSCGIPEENVIFLGYGDDWGDVHLYNAPADEVQTSHAGYTATYGTETHPAWSTGTPYTTANFMNDLQSVIEKYMPDVIYCVDYDGHADHKAASMTFERAMGRIRRAHPDYTPLIFKGFAYPTAYYAAKDFYSLNILSTVSPYGGDYVTNTHIYRWEDRIRIPVAASTLSRSILNADVYRQTCLYASQSARFQATGIINGDKVFWMRDSSSVTYNAAVTATSGEPERLNDFMLEECVDVNRDGRQPFDGIWTPYAGDEEKTATVTFNAPVTIDRICLYDNPSFEDNVLNAELVLYPENEQTTEPVRIETGALKAGGEATEFTIEPVTVRAVRVRLLETEGQGAGLNELEAYSGRKDYGMKLLKLCDENGDFVYDFIYSGEDTETFRLYALNCSGNAADYQITCRDLSDTGAFSGSTAFSDSTGSAFSADGTAEACTVICASRGCGIVVNGDGTFTVTVPKGKQCVLTVTAPDGSVSDSVVLRNNGLLMKLGQGIESFVYHGYGKMQNTAAYTMAKTVFHIFTEK